MRPEAHDVLGVFAGTLLTAVQPEIGSEYFQKDVGIMSYILMAAAEEYNRAAEIRVRENKDMRGVFRAAAEHVKDADLKQRLEEAAKGEDTSLLVEDLNISNDALRGLLIEVHELAESASLDGAAWASGLDRHIWNVLEASVQRRAFTFFPA